jgi:microcystin-dependent protein
MSKITLQYSIANDTAVDAVPVEANFSRIESHINQEVIERGGSVAMTGQLKLAGNPVAADDAANKAYVDSLLSVGMMQMYGGSTDPAGGVWLLCDGRELETASYPDLFSVIGNSYGSGSAGRFKIPDMRGFMPLGASGTDALGSTGGSRNAVVVTHTHTIDHTHAGTNTGFVSSDHSHTFSGNTSIESADHSHVLRGVGESTSGGGFGEGNVADISNGGFAPAFNTGGVSAFHTHSYSGTTSGISANHQHTVNVPGFSGSSGSAGVSGTNANLPPYKAVNFLIKAK